jgi:prevent-host-death family protein
MRTEIRIPQRAPRQFVMLICIVAEGEEIEIVKRGKVVAKLVPVEETPKPLVVPDIMARLKRIYGDKMSPVTGAETIRWDRDRD